MQFIKDFLEKKKYFGVFNAIKLIAIPRVAYHLGVKKNLYFYFLLRWMKKENESIIMKYADNRNTGYNCDEDYNIWTCWWQGIEEMPSIIKFCHESLLRNAGRHKVILITKDNWSEFIEIPKFIINKFEAGKIKIQHLSDVIRILLLEKYGGTWIDASIYVTRPLPERLKFFMPRIKDNKSLNQGKWVFSIIHGPSNHIIFKFMKDILLAYWKKNNISIDYLMFDGFLRIGMENIKEIKTDIDDLIINSPDIWSSRYSFNQEVNINHLKYLIGNNEFLSFTWRIEYKKLTEGGLTTYYGALIDKNIT